MAGREIDLATWPRAAAFRLFSGYQQPHYAIVSRLDVTRLSGELKSSGTSPYRACIYAFGSGVHAVPELRTRFRGDRVFEYDSIDLSMTVPLDDGSFAYGYVAFDADWQVFDRACLRAMEEAKRRGGLAANTGRDDLAYLSCLPWLDFTALTNALPGPQDCIPRISWGRFTDDGNGRRSVAVAVEVHHALVDGAHLGRFFAEAQAALDSIEQA